LRNIDTEQQIKHVVNAYDQDPVRVRRQLAALFRNGQRIISTIIWHERLPLETKFEGIIVSSREGRLPSRQRANLESLLRDIYDVGFREIHIRLAQKGDRRCRTWSSWNQDLYDENYAFLKDVRSVAYGVFDRAQPKPNRDAPVITAEYVDLKFGWCVPISQSDSGEGQVRPSIEGGCIASADRGASSTGSSSQ
jgi:hypothetical protein